MGYEEFEAEYLHHFREQVEVPRAEHRARLLRELAQDWPPLEAVPSPRLRSRLGTALARLRGWIATVARRLRGQEAGVPSPEA